MIWKKIVIRTLVPLNYSLRHHLECHIKPNYTASLQEEFEEDQEDPNAKDDFVGVTQSVSRIQLRCVCYARNEPHHHIISVG